MKFINRFVGMVVITVAIIFFILVKANEMHFLKDAFADWVTSVNAHITAIYEDTKSFISSEDINLPANVKNNGDGSYTFSIGGKNYRFSLSGDEADTAAAKPEQSY